MSLNRFFKRLARSETAGRVASRAIGLYIRFVAATSRWTIEGRGHVDALDAAGRKIVFAFWHERLLMVPLLRRETERPVYMLISAHRDGEIIANAVAPFGIEFIRGSAANPKKSFKNKSGAPALARMIAALDDGAIVGVKPDGPRGPARRAQLGVARRAAMTGAAIVPCAYAASRGRRLRTWDRFFLAAPFSRGAFVAGRPLEPAPTDADAATLKAAAQALTDALDATTARADALVAPAARRAKGPNGVAEPALAPRRRG
ncbi:MAG: lysophospholipid acyltransferase family protein [Parvularculaceae bacterium]